MREILFRGKRLDNGEWIQGYYCEGEGMSYEGEYTSIIPINPTINLNLTDWRVHPETVGQYTGLTDKNGTKIFEGDIVSFLDGETISCESGYEVSEYYSTGEVKYHLYPYPFFDISNRESVDVEDVFDGCEIVGTIHDNPELLK